MPKLFHLLITSLTNQQIPINTDLFSYLPHSYKRVGHIAIINLHEKLLEFKTPIAEALLDILNPPIKTIARFVKPIDGVTRKPTLEWLAGEQNFETVHIEHGTKFCINPQELMFSAGNHFERKRMIDFISSLPLEKVAVLDMFSCIGNLSLPLIKHVPKVNLVFLEINPVAISYLQQSLDKNHIDPTRYSIIEGDNHATTPENVANIVFMGYFGIDSQQLRNALSSLLLTALEGWIFIHDTGSISGSSSVLKKFEQIVQQDSHWSLESAPKHVVKSIGPAYEHWVFDCHLIRSP